MGTVMKDLLFKPLSLPVEDMTDARVMKKVLQRQLAGFDSGALVIEECRVLESSYKSYFRENSVNKTFLSVGYELIVSDAIRRKTGKQVFYARAYPDAQSLKEFHDTKLRVLKKPRFGEPVSFLPKLNAIIYAFPNDPELPHLAHAVSGAYLRKHLPYKRLPLGFHTHGYIPLFDVDIVNYKPEQTCDMRYRLYSIRYGYENPLEICGKTYRDFRGQEVYKNISKFIQAALQSEDAFVTPRPLGYSGKIKTLWLESVDAKPLKRFISPTKNLDLLEKTGASLAWLHQQSITEKSVKQRRVFATEFLRKAQKLAEAYPRIRKSLLPLTVRLNAGTSKLSARDLRQIHGKFKLKQIYSNQGKIYLFNLDALTYGDPTKDLACFLIDLNLCGFSRPCLNSMIDAFLDGYASRNGFIDYERLSWHIAVKSINKAYRLWHYEQNRADVSNEIKRIIEFFNLVEERMIAA